jgi:hypothetical protein
MTIEWGIIFMGSFAACAYFSYNYGFKDGSSFGMTSILDQLHEKGLIELDDETEEEDN